MNTLFDENNQVKDLYIYMMRWRDKVNPNIEYDTYLQLFRGMYETTNVVKLRDFQYRLLLGKIFINNILCHWKIVETNICELCNISKQTPIHLFSQCNKIKPLWIQMEHTLNIDNTYWGSVNIMENNVPPKNNHVINYIVLIMKQYIYRQKCLDKPITFLGIVHEIRQIEKTELYTAKITCETGNHHKKWGPVLERLSNVSFP